ncbi:GNAT family N-acetyltransferase [Rhodovibrionaceae bacterium A322]
MERSRQGISLIEITPDRADLSALLDVIKAAFAEQVGTLDPPSSSETFTLEDLEARLRQGPAFQISDAKGPCGCVLTSLAGDHLYLGKLAIHPRARRQGLAVALIDAVCDAARRQGLPAVELEYRIALTGNHSLYQSQGFQIIAEEAHPGYSHPTFYRARKTL